MSSSTIDVEKNRFLGFLIWQSIQSAAIFVLFRIFFLAPFRLLPSLEACLSIFVFNLSVLLFSFSVAQSSSPHPSRPASFWELTLALFRFIFVSGGSVSTADSRRRAKLALTLVLFVAVSGVSGLLSVVSLCGWLSLRDAFSGTSGVRALVHGFLYGFYYVFKRRWVLRYPIVQRPLFFSFKMGIAQAVQQSLKLSSGAYLISALLVVLLPPQYRTQISIAEFMGKQFIFYIGSFAVFLCWELCHHLYQVLHTKRFIFAPPKGSAAAETNPSEYLLEALEESSPRSFLQYLAYLDLCMVCDNNVDPWRRAAFFEETGETYKRVVAACLKPLEQFTSKLADGLDMLSADKTSQLSNQLNSPADLNLEPKFDEGFDNFQLCTWCARSVASLTARSRDEDRFGVAQLSGSNAAVISTLLSCLMAVETMMGKKTHLQPQHELMGPGSIKWTTLNTVRKDPTVEILSKLKGGPLHAKAYSMADILRNSVYCITSAFHDEIQSAKPEIIEKDWITSGKPLYGSRELLVQKLRFFLDFRAC